MILDEAEMPEAAFHAKYDTLNRFKAEMEERMAAMQVGWPGCMCISMRAWISLVGDECVALNRFKAEMEERMAAMQVSRMCISTCVYRYISC